MVEEVRCADCTWWLHSLGRDYTTTGRCKLTGAAVRRDFYCADGMRLGEKNDRCIHRRLCINECPCDYLEVRGNG